MNILVKIYNKEHPDPVKCNSCEWEGTENSLLYDASTELEHCPNCEKSGCLMDVRV